MRTARAAGLLLVLAGLGTPGRESVSAQTSPESGELLHHVLDVRIDPATHHLSATDEVHLPAGNRTTAWVFALNDQLTITRSVPPVEEVREAAGVRGPASGLDARITVKRYRVKDGLEARTVTLTYDGVINLALSDEKEQYTRGFRDTPGLIDAKGVYLAASSYWYPRSDDALITFSLNAFDPPGWHLISQGNGTSRDGEGRANWDSAGAMDEIYLVGGPLHVFKDSAGEVESLVYLHEPTRHWPGSTLRPRLNTSRCTGP